MKKVFNTKANSQGSGEPAHPHSHQSPCCSLNQYTKPKEEPTEEPQTWLYWMDAHVPVISFLRRWLKKGFKASLTFKCMADHLFADFSYSIARVCNHVIAVYSENKLQHYATAYRNHKSAGEMLCLVSNVYFSSKPG